jgi:hypothetical protein
MGLINYDGRHFAPTSSASAVGRYSQHDDLVWAWFAGDHIRSGRLVGTADRAGVITAAYCQVMVSGEVITGTVRSSPTTLPDGRIRLTETWRRADGAAGVSTIEELP